MNGRWDGVMGIIYGVLIKPGSWLTRSSLQRPEQVTDSKRLVIATAEALERKEHLSFQVAQGANTLGEFYHLL